MSNLDEIFTPDQLSFIDGWPGYRQAKLGLEGETVHVLLQRLVLAYLDWYPFETEEADLDWHTSRERLALFCAPRTTTTVISSDTSSAPPSSSPPSSPSPFFRHANLAPEQSPDRGVATPEKSIGISQYKPETGCGGSVPRMVPITFEDWVIHVDESWGTRPRTWQEVRRQDFVDEVSGRAAHLPGWSLI
ncbi:hypothetical protein EV421DRAFT_1903279 [Armillaria borealis]|uniref:Uncharacterized protein n=1 Tax=Armillaria borealis TaxID=47425 RepID=A0AA39JK08_9AGAR|nr:hypothetical protein EV421DRAFT_1903279 [Armillaria borealis]